MAHYNAAGPQDISDEPDWIKTHNHRVGLRNGHDYTPGLTHSGDDWRYEIEKEAEMEEEELKEMIAKGNLITVRDVMNKQENFRLRRPEVHPQSWRYVLQVTEDFIKQQQPWFINQKIKEKVNLAQSRQEQKSSEQQPQKGTGQSQDVAPEKPHQESGNKYTSDPEAYVQILKHEQEYMRNLAINDGQGVSPVNKPTFPEDLDETDQFTPDNWVGRSDRLLRLTGKHPFNGEANLTEIFDAGFITPNKLHYVRNHGAVPHTIWESHKIEVTAGERIYLKMDDLAEKFPSVNIPVFMACDGARRKEINMIRRSKGFDFGPGAIGCAYWKGALLRDILLAAGVCRLVDGVSRKRLWVNFEGADELVEGKYATCIALDYAMNQCNDVLVAYAMNNLPLPADHGYPVRVIIPGFVGGRCVKWLSRIWTTEYENDSYHHIYDNRTLPSFVTHGDSDIAEAMFRNPSTVINEQTLNSVIVRPAHREMIPLGKIKPDQSYRIEGFAYTGGGDEIQAVEVSLDDGCSWIYCTRRYPDAPLRHHRKFWTWLHWHVDINVTHLLRVNTITVRCFDARKNTQPKEPTWNLLGMMNNSWYVVKPELVESSNGSESYLIFRHPCEIGQGNSGWMQPSVERQIESVRQAATTPQRKFTREEIEKHNTEGDTWIVIDGKVYNVTNVLKWHPGGKQAILPHAGQVHQETTSEFRAIHDDFAYEKLKEYAVGVVTQKTMGYINRSKDEEAKRRAEMPAPSPEMALKRHRWTRVKLISKVSVSEDTSRYTFSLPYPAKKLGVAVGQHILVGFHFKDRTVFRPYTPTRPTAEEEEDGTFDLTVKTYFPGPSQPGGTMSNIFDCLLDGEEVEVKGPLGEIQYRGGGQFEIDKKQLTFKRITLIIGGSGITPAYQLITRIVKSEEDETKIKLIYANKTKQDILMREELTKCEEKNPGQLQVYHVLSHAGKDWQGEKGRVDKKIIYQYSFPPHEENLALLCGPPAMIKANVLPILKLWGYDEDSNLFGF